MYQRILRAVANTPWAIDPVKAQAILEVLALRAAGGRFTDADIADRIGPRGDQRPGPVNVANPVRGQDGERVAGAGDMVAVIPVQGTICHRIGAMEESSGGIAAERVGLWFARAVANRRVGTIVLDIDSPGGALPGVPELAADIFKARGTKRIIAVANSMAASAAFWLAAQAHEIVVTPSGDVGSVGVWLLHQDFSGAFDKEGIVNTFIFEGDRKLDGNFFEPLSDAARADLEKSVKEAMDMFVADLARGRGVSTDVVRRDFGEGRVFSAEDAQDRRMVDRIATLREVVAGALDNPPRREDRGSSAESGALTRETNTPALAVELTRYVEPIGGRDEDDTVLPFAVARERLGLEDAPAQAGEGHAARTAPDLAALEIECERLGLLELEARYG